MPSSINPMQAGEANMDFWNKEVPIGLVKVGRVVARAPKNWEEPDVVNYGHITGFSLNLRGELIVSVKFPNSPNPLDVHPGNLQLL